MKGIDYMIINNTRHQTVIMSAFKLSITRLKSKKEFNLTLILNLNN